MQKPGTSTVAADPRTGKIASKIAALKRRASAIQSNFAIPHPTL